MNFIAYCSGFFIIIIIIIIIIIMELWSVPTI
jgi:hypothetical protein